MKAPLNALRTRIPGDVCVYCGDAAQTMEHFPPKSVTSRGFLLPSCRECNVLAACEWSFDFEKKGVSR